MGNPSSGTDRPGFRFPPWLGTVLVSALSLGCLLWVYHDFDWHQELPKLARVHWLWIVLAVGCDVAVYLTQAWRWNVLMQPVSRLPFWKSVQAIYIGLFANEVLPLRSGELIRCYLVAVWDGVRFPLVLSSALIERLIDGMWLILGITITTQFVDLPNEIDAGVTVLASVVAAMSVLVLYAVFNPRFARHVATRHRWAAPLRLLVEGLHDMGRARTFPAALAISVLYLGLQIVPIHAMLEGYGLDLPWGAAVIVLIVLRLGTVVPAAPGNVGLFHLCGYLALHRVLGVEAQTAKLVTGMMFFIITVPLLAAGALALAATELEIREIFHRARSGGVASPPAAARPEHAE